MPRLARSDAFAPAAIGLLTFVSRMLVRARVPTEWDSAQLAIGLLHFDVRVDQPHAPGYWLYVLLGRVVRAVTPFDAHASLLVVSAIGSAAAVVAAWYLGREVGGRWLGAALSALLATHPLLWFYGSIVATYSFDALACTLAILFALRAGQGRRLVVVAPFVIALLGGFRPSLLFFLGPVVLLAMLRAARDVRDFVLGVGAGIVGLTLWLVPASLEQPGGFTVLRRANTELWQNAAHLTSPLLNAAPDMINGNQVTALGWTLGSAFALLPIVLIACLYAIPRFRPSPDSELRTWASRWLPWLLVVVILPQLASAFLLHFGKSGYVLGWQPALTLLVLLPASRLGGRWRTAATTAVAIAVVLSAQRFLFAEGMVPRRLADASPTFAHGRGQSPFPASRQQIRRIDADLRSYASLAADFPPDRTVFVVPGGPSGIRYRQLSYLQPDLLLHFFVQDFDWSKSQHRQQSYERDHIVEVPDGFDAVVITDGPPPDLRALLESGHAEAVELRSGAVVWVVERGSVVSGVRIGSGPTILSGS
jgi:hypothetical protein